VATQIKEEHHVATLGKSLRDLEQLQAIRPIAVARDHDAVRLRRVEHPDLKRLAIVADEGEGGRWRRRLRDDEPFDSASGLAQGES
jgi:hypothetical protein